MECLKSEGSENIVSYMDDAYEKYVRLWQKQGYSNKAEILHIEVLDKRNKILGVEHPDMIKAMTNSAAIY